MELESYERCTAVPTFNTNVALGLSSPFHKGARADFAGQDLCADEILFVEAKPDLQGMGMVASQDL